MAARRLAAVDMFILACAAPPQAAASYEHQAVPTVASESNSKATPSSKAARGRTAAGVSPAASSVFVCMPRRFVEMAATLVGILFIHFLDRNGQRFGVGDDDRISDSHLSESLGIEHSCGQVIPTRTFDRYSLCGTIESFDRGDHFKHAESTGGR